MAKQAITSETGVKPYDVQRIRQDFPGLNQTAYGFPLIYLDNAATTQKPQAVIDAVAGFYREDCSNVHRGVHLLSERATKKYEDARLKVCRFINASSEKEIVFVRGTTEAINLVGQTYGRQNVGQGDEIIISAMEHHSNIVPWQLLCEEKNAVLRVVPMDRRGEFQFDKYEKLLNERTKLVAIVHVSNALGSVNPVREIIALAHQHGVRVLVDGAQAAPHIPIDVQGLDCDFYALSGHKIYGPTGIGVLYCKAELLESMPPYQGGGDMISSVTFEKTLYNKIPFKFEAGTPNISGAIGLAAAVDYLQGLGVDEIESHERDVLAYATEKIATLPGVTLIGTARHKAGVLSFIIDGIHPHDVGTILDQEGIAIRTGHHCAQPVMEFFGVPATARASLGLYNTRADIDALVAGIIKVQEVFN
jgi:cysteine desulfurase / selenocysteine lyase